GSGGRGPGPALRRGGQDDAEARAADRRLVVEEIAAVRRRVRARDRETEPAARGGGRLAARERLEQAVADVPADTGAPVLDGDTEPLPAALGRHGDRRRAVARRVQEQVRQDPLERDWVDLGLELLGRPDRDSRVSGR